MSLLTHSNGLIDPQAEALNVSNWVTTEGLPESYTFYSANDDPDNFRIEVFDPLNPELQTTAIMEVIRPGEGVVDTFDQFLNEKQGHYFRGPFLRLVSDGVDDAIRGDQTILVKLGDTIRVSYKDETVVEIPVGRPSGENNNGPSQLMHDIREVRVAVYVFRNATGTGPAVSRQRVLDDIEYAIARLAQATIRLSVEWFDMGGPSDPGIPLPQGPGVDWSDGFEVSPHLFFNALHGFSPEEQALFDGKIGDNSRISVFYVESFQAGSQLLASAYNPYRNRTLFADGTNNIVVDGSKPQSSAMLGHEMLRILMNAIHVNPPQEDPSALFYQFGADETVDGPRRLEPYPGRGYISNETYELREAAEDIPQ